MFCFASTVNNSLVHLNKSVKKWLSNFSKKSVRCLSLKKWSTLYISQINGQSSSTTLFDLIPLNEFKWYWMVIVCSWVVFFFHFIARVWTTSEDKGWILIWGTSVLSGYVCLQKPLVAIKFNMLSWLHISSWFSFKFWPLPVIYAKRGLTVCKVSNK